jgi:hypothetical protein
MANHSKAMTHHGHIGAALKAGNAQQAMHHVGHLMLALRAVPSADSAPSNTPGSTNNMAPGPMDDADGDEMNGATGLAGTAPAIAKARGPMSLPSLKRPAKKSTGAKHPAGLSHAKRCGGVSVPAAAKAPAAPMPSSPSAPGFNRSRFAAFGKK